ncbi:hypothetical protein ACH47Z_03945 [Streptomyces sp. NPDC020192]
MATDNTTASVNWAAQPRYRETAASPARRTPDRLRAVLDRHLARV